MGVPRGQTGSAWPLPCPGDSLTYEMKDRRNVEEEEALDEWIEVMEKVLPLSLMATKGGIESLISLCSTLIEEQKKRTQSRFREPLGGLDGDGLDALSGRGLRGICRVCPSSVSHMQQTAEEEARVQSWGERPHWSQSCSELHCTG